MRGAVMLAGWKNMHPGEQYLTKHIDLYDHIEAEAYVARSEHFESVRRRWPKRGLRSAIG
jgi:poly(3-hydroxybutyrate) depolymerase